MVNRDEYVPRHSLQHRPTPKPTVADESPSIWSAMAKLRQTAVDAQEGN